MPDFAETVSPWLKHLSRVVVAFMTEPSAFTWLKRLSRVVLALMVLSMIYAIWLSLANWSFIAV